MTKQNVIIRLSVLLLLSVLIVMTGLASVYFHVHRIVESNDLFRTGSRLLLLGLIGYTLFLVSYLVIGNTRVVITHRKNPHWYTFEHSTIKDLLLMGVALFGYLTLFLVLEVLLW